MSKVYTSSVIAAPIDVVWNRIRDFNGLPAWAPFVEASEIENGLASAEVGCIRNFRLRDGGIIRERLLALSDPEHACSYSILESPMNVENYVARLRLLPITDGDLTFAEWSAEFDCRADRAAELIHHIGVNVFQAAFDNLKRLSTC